MRECFPCWPYIRAFILIWIPYFSWRLRVPCYLSFDPEHAWYFSLNSMESGKQVMAAVNLLSISRKVFFYHFCAIGSYQSLIQSITAWQVRFRSDALEFYSLYGCSAYRTPQLTVHDPTQKRKLNHYPPSPKFWRNRKHRNFYHPLPLLEMV